MKSPILDFIQGQRDCRNGVPHAPGKGKDYDRGYAYERWRGEYKETISELGRLL